MITLGPFQEFDIPITVVVTVTDQTQDWQASFVVEQESPAEVIDDPEEDVKEDVIEETVASYTIVDPAETEITTYSYTVDKGS